MYILMGHGSEILQVDDSHEMSSIFFSTKLRELLQNTVKPVLSGHSKRRPKLVFLRPITA